MTANTELDYYAAKTVRELRQELNAYEDKYLNAQAYIRELHRRINSQHRYIAELEKQLEPSVVAEIRDALSEDQQSE